MANEEEALLQSSLAQCTALTAEVTYLAGVLAPLERYSSLLARHTHLSEPVKTLLKDVSSSAARPRTDRNARQVLSRPLWEEFEVWLKLQRTQVPEGTKIAEAINYSLNAWKALTLHLDDGAVAIDNNLIERQIKPWKLGAKNWLFAGSALGGQRAAVVMSLVQSAKLNGLDPWAYLRDVLARIHTHPSHRLDELLPHRWRPA